MKFRSLDDLVLLASDREGECLSNEFTDEMSDHSWRCKNGHQFKKNRAQVRDLSASNWCSICNKAQRDKKRALKMLKRIRHHAAKNNGECLSNTYHSPNSILKFKCAKGHVWETTAHSILYSQSWCPKCFKER